MSNSSTLQHGDSIGRDLGREKENLAVVLDFFELMFNRHMVRDAAHFLGENYTQHNPFVQDGKKPSIEFFEKYFKENPSSRVRIVRSATSGDLVFLHVHVTKGGDDIGMAIADIFRVQDGLLVEHWDVIQEVPEQRANANSQF